MEESALAPAFALLASAVVPPPAESRASAQHWPALDGLRCVAVAVVFLIHLPMRTWQGGFIGVDIFFTLSGFLITTVLLNDARRAGIRITRFYERRIVRLYPALLIGLVIALGAVHHLHKSKHDFFWDAVTSIFFVYNIRYVLQPQVYTAVGQYWSLSVEEQFYIVWAPLLKLAHRRIGLGVRALKLGLALLAALVVTQLVVGLLVTASSIPYYYYLFPPHADELMLGALVAIAHHNGLLGGRIATVLRNPLAPAACLAGLLAFCWRLPARTDRWLLAGGWFLFACMAAIVIMHCTSGASGPVVWLLDLAPMRWIGRRSYAIYIFHLAFIHVARNHYGKHALSVGLTAGAATLIAAGLSWHFVEAPLLRWRDRRAPAPSSDAST